MMKDSLYPMIFKRKSFHLFRNVGTAVVLFASLAVTISEAYKLIKESEELSWSLC